MNFPSVSIFPAKQRQLLKLEQGHNTEAILQAQKPLVYPLSALNEEVDNETQGRV